MFYRRGANMTDGVDPIIDKEHADGSISPDADARRLVLEIIATLVNVKKIAAAQLLGPAGVPPELVRRFLSERDSTTGEKRTKREAGAVILEELTRAGNDGPIMRRLIEIASTWDAFHLAQDQYVARGVVQKAREMLGTLAAFDEREQRALEQRTREQQQRRQSERNAQLKSQSELLLQQFDDATASGEPHQRGYLLQDLLNRLFDLHGFPVSRAFQRNDGGEQIDGAFEMDGWQYLVECRWRAKLADIRDLDGLRGQVQRSGRQTMGLFLSINGWSDNVVPLMKQSPDKSIILMEGYDLRCALARHVDLRVLMKAKLRALNLDAEPYFSVQRLLG
jgi:hypothetical protein